MTFQVRLQSMAHCVNRAEVGFRTAADAVHSGERQLLCGAGQVGCGRQRYVGPPLRLLLRRGAGRQQRSAPLFLCMRFAHHTHASSSLAIPGIVGLCSRDLLPMLWGLSGIAFDFSGGNAQGGAMPQRTCVPQTSQRARETTKGVRAP